MAMTRDQFFAQPLYMVHVTGWPPEAVRPDAPVEKPVVAKNWSLVIAIRSTLPQSINRIEGR